MEIIILLPDTENVINCCKIRILGGWNTFKKSKKEVIRNIGYIEIDSLETNRTKKKRRY